MDLRAHMTARILAGATLVSHGRLLVGHKRDGAAVMLDADTGGELVASEDPALGPFYVHSTDQPVDGDPHIVRQFWDLSRAETCGVPILWNHDADRFLGQWVDLGVRNLEQGQRLVGRPRFDLGDAEGANRARQAREGLLKATSTGWRPGFRTRRSEMPPDSPYYAEAREDGCGQPDEGYVMGSEREPNLLIETSFTPIPADRNAIEAGRMYTGAQREIAAQGAQGIERLLSLAGSDPRSRAWVRRIAREVFSELLLERGLVGSASSPTPATRRAPSTPSPSPDLLGDFVNRS